MALLCAEPPMTLHGAPLKVTSDAITITPSGPIQGSIRPPGSKSITNRALVCAALAKGQSTLSGALDSEDTRVMIESLRYLGIAIECRDAGATLIVDGCGGRLLPDNADLFVANSGTTIRFLTAMVALGRGTFRLDGIARMHQRPIADLLDALNQLGAQARSEAGNDCPPVIVEAKGLLGGTATIRGDISSQFLSGLLMVAPFAQESVRIEVDGPLVSQPYVDMTLEVIRAFGGKIQRTAASQFDMSPQQAYTSRLYLIEPDASAASYFWAAAAITGGTITVEGLSRDALQGDVAFCDCLGRMGCDVTYASDQITVIAGELSGIEVDMNAISDTVQTLAAVALFAKGPTTIRGVAHIRHKETDRIGDLACELRKLGAEVAEFEDGMRIMPGKLQGAQIDTYNDHRMAMSLALAGLKQPGVVINDPGCTEKTYPRYFSDLASLCRTENG